MADGTAEALKWLALALMVLDHVNKYLYNDALPWVSPIARISFPLFGFVLALVDPYVKTVYCRI